MNTNNIFLSLLLLVGLSFFMSCASDAASSSATAEEPDDNTPSAITVETSTPTIKVDSAQIKKLVAEKEAELAEIAAKQAEEKAEKEKLASIEAEEKAKAKEEKRKAEKKRLVELKRKKAEADRKAAEAKATANSTIAVSELPVSKPVIKPAPAKPKKAGAKIKFDTKTHNFGTIKEGEVVKYEFYYTNVGTEELVIKDASATCGCTAPGFSFFPLAPGLSSAISVTFNSANKAGAQRPEVTIITNGYPTRHVLTMEGVVEK